MNRQNFLPAFPADRKNGPMQSMPRNHLQASPSLVALPIRWCFLLFIFSIVFENLDVLGMWGYFSLAKAAGFLLAGVALLQPSVCFARPPKAFWFFLTYVCVCFLRSLLGSDFGEATLSVLFSFAQCLTLFWISYNILRYGGMRKAVYATFVLSNLAAALLTHFGIATTDSFEVGTGVRESSLGQNLNMAGFMYGVGMLSAIALAIDKTVPFLARLSLIPMFVLLGTKCIATGSRGGMLAVAIGILAYFLAIKGLGRRIKGLFVVAALAGFSTVVTSGPTAPGSVTESVVATRSAGASERFVRASASTATPICEDQISSGACSTQPGRGNI